MRGIHSPQRNLSSLPFLSHSVSSPSEDAPNHSCFLKNASRKIHPSPGTRTCSLSSSSHSASREPKNTLEGEEPSLENRGGEGGGDCNTPMLMTMALPLQNIFHCAMSLDQLYFARPVPLHSGYRSPLRGLYLCGSGAHPGE